MNKKKLAYIIHPMTLKKVERKYIEEILAELGLESFSRPYSGLIDQGDFGPVATYIPLYPEEYKKLSPALQRHVYLIAPKRYGLICFLPRLFDTPDGGKVISLTKIYNHWNVLIRVTYKTDKGGEFETVHTIRRNKLFDHLKNKKIPTNIKVVSQ